MGTPPGVARAVGHAGDTVRWRRTVIELDGLQARNGATDTGTVRGENNGAIELLHGVSCGDRTMAAHGISLSGR